jgi:ATP-binding cassette subfamily C (CFTR/MRP) protein 1
MLVSQIRKKLTFKSGKSTFLSVLLRLLDPTEGSILVDGIDISTLPRNFVRERLICLPQDPWIMSGTFEFNLNPGGTTIDPKVMEYALQQVQLWDLVIKRGGLYTEFQPESLSHGEQQLLALARAIVRKQLAGGWCILVLDEATSNLDAKTEAVVQDVLQKEFQNHTVITVAHRLDTLKHCDLVVELGEGRVVKIGSPNEVNPTRKEDYPTSDEKGATITTTTL